MKNDADKRWKKRIKPLWLLFSLLILAPALYFSLIPVDITRYTPQIKSSIESRINGTIDMERIELRILPYPKMKIKGFKLSDRKETVIKARAVNASVMLFPLFFKRIDVKNLEIDGADIIVRRDKEGEINLRKIPLEEWSIISLKKLRLRDAMVVFADEMTEKPTFFEMDNVKAYFNRTSSGTTYTATGRLLPDTTFYVSGEAKEDGEKTELSGTLSVDNLKIKEVSHYVKKEDLRGVTVNGKVGAKLVYSLSVGNGGGNAGGNGGRGMIKGTLTSKELVIKGPDFFRDTILLEEGSCALELGWTDKQTSLLLERARLKLKGFDLIGSFKITSPENKVEIQKLSSTPIPAGYLKEHIELKNFPGAIKDAIDGIKDASGSIKINNLTLSSQDILKTLSMDAELKDAGFSHQKFKRPFSSITGLVSFKDGGFRFKNLSGSYGKSTIRTLLGEIRPRQADLRINPMVRLDIAAEVDASDFLDELENPLFKQVTASGKADLKLSMEGELPDWERPSGRPSYKSTAPLILKASIDLAKAGLGYGEMLKKGEGRPMTLETALKLNKDALAIEKGVVRFGESSFDVKGRIAKGGLTYSITLFSENIRFEDLVSLSPDFTKEKNLRGTVSLNVTDKKEGKNRKAALTGDIRLSNGGHFKTAFFPKEIAAVDAVVRFEGSGYNLLLENFKMGESDFSGKISIADMEKGIMDFNLHSRSFNTRDFFPYGAESSGKTPLLGRGKITIKEGALWGITFQNLSTVIEMEKNSARFNPLTFTSHSGQITANLVFPRDAANPVFLEVESKVSMMDIESLLKELGAKEKILGGRLTSEVKLSVKKNKTPATSGLDGEIKLLCKDGRLWKFVVFSKIFSIVNILSITDLFDTGLPYRQLTANFAIKDGVVSYENLLFDSDSMKISSVGSIDIPRMTIDATMGLHPFVTIDKIVSSIPLAGWIIGGKEKSTVNMYYEIKGPLKDPKVDPVPVESVGKKILGIFQRILEMPADVIEPLKEK